VVGARIALLHHDRPAPAQVLPCRPLDRAQGAALEAGRLSDPKPLALGVELGDGVDADELCEPGQSRVRDVVEVHD
jgi:hypothetical protein